MKGKASSESSGHEPSGSKLSSSSSEDSEVCHTPCSTFSLSLSLSLSLCDPLSFQAEPTTPRKAPEGPKEPRASKASGALKDGAEASLPWSAEFKAREELEGKEEAFTEEFEARLKERQAALLDTVGG